MKSHVIGAIPEGKGSDNPVNMQIDAMKFICSLFDIATTKHQPVGLGKDFWLEDDKMGGAAFVYEEQLFRKFKGDNSRRTNQNSKLELRKIYKTLIKTMKLRERSLETLTIFR